MEKRGWSEADFVFVIGDAYVDHPSFGPAIISRLLERYGYKVCIIAQPDWKTTKALMFLESQDWVFWCAEETWILWSTTTPYQKEKTERCIFTRRRNGTQT